MEVNRGYESSVGADGRADQASEEFMLVASSDIPSDRQRSEACFSMLREVEGILEGLKEFIRAAEQGGQSLERLLGDPQNRALIRDRVNEALIKLEALKNQCGDILPASEARKIDELEQKLRRTLREIEGQGGSFAINVDWGAVGQGLMDGIGAGLGILGGVAGFILRQIFGGRHAY